jgi:hypothetical protein
MSLRNILGVVALLALLAGSFVVQGWHDKAKGYDAAVAERDRTQQNFNAYRDDIGRRDAASKGYHDELEKLRTGLAARPAPVVRLCQPAVLPAAAPAAAGPVAAAPAGGLVSPAAGQAVETGPNIGPELDALMLRADGLSAQLRAVHRYMETPADER